MHDSPLIFFSLEDARKLVAERDRLLRQYEEVNRKVEALAVLVPDHMREKIFGSRSLAGTVSASVLGAARGNEIVALTAPPPPSLTDSIVDMLDDCLEVLSQDQVEEAVWDMPDFRDKERFTVEAIAKALEKLSRKGRITKRGLNYCSKQISAAEISVYNGPTMVQATEKILRSAKESLEAWEVIDKLKDDPEVGERVKNRPNGVYAALSRLTS